jgi:hypothetical protein
LLHVADESEDQALGAPAAVSQRLQIVVRDCLEVMKQFQELAGLNGRPVGDSQVAAKRSGVAERASLGDVQLD